MRNTKKYPKCGGSDIILVPGFAGAYGNSSSIMKDLRIESIKSAVLVDKYICTTCGLSEEWIDPDYMDKLKKGCDEI